MLVEARRTEQGLELDLTGEWRVAHLAQLDAELAAVDLASARCILVATTGLTVLDLSAAWRLRGFLRLARERGVEVSFRGAPPDQIRLIDATLHEPAAAPPPPAPELGIEALTEQGLVEIGVQSVRYWRDTRAALAFVGRVSATMGRGLARWRRLRPTSIARHIYDTGITAMPITALIAFLISVIIAYLSA
ncbi:MAG TPA: STAS domain-containing protein, partial [Steroidobacteraceae bacterium]|nr:STAS domain-containing protein [Steroidobacteraceae bacterium]